MARRTATAAQQFRALFLKNLALQRHQVGVTIVQLVVPCALIGLVGLIQVLVDRAAVQNTAPTPELYSPLNVSRTIPLATHCNDTYLPDGCVTLPDFVSLLYSLPFFYYTAPAELQAAVGECDYNGTCSGLLGQTEQVGLGLDPVGNRTPSLFPFFLPEEDAQELNDHLVDVYTLWKVRLNDDGLGPQPELTDFPYLVNETIKWIYNKQYDNLLPYGAIIFRDLRTTDESVLLSYTAMAATRYGGMPLTPVDNGSLSYAQLLYPDIDRRGNLLNLLHNNLAKYAHNNASSPPPEILTMYQGQPQQPDLSVDIASLWGVFLYGFCTSLLMPVFMANVVTDKQERILLMMQMSGLKMAVYWGVTFIYNFLLYVLVLGALSGVSLAFQFRLFTQTSPVLLLVFGLLWGNLLIVFCFFMSTFFSQTRTSSIIGYLLAIIGVGVSNLLNLSIFLGDRPPFWYMMFPPWVWYRLIFLMENACLNFQCYQLDDMFGNPEVAACFWYMLAEGIVLYPLTWYLQQVLPNQFGVRRHPLFFLAPLKKLVQRKPPAGYDALATDEAGPASATSNLTPTSAIVTEEQLRTPASLTRKVSVDFYQDEDVEREEERVARGDVPDNAPVVIRNLRKEYSGRMGQPPKVAVHNLSLVIEENECFGLLGANGAGKTTLISVLTGVYSATSGTARLAGHEITEDIAAVQREIGVCPQFDVFYPDLTTREHVLFFARLKGTPRSEEADVVAHSLKQVGLTEQADKLSKHLSGGMRRRLSMAMAIIGDPKIIILDEPTTGLDPLTRRQIWEILQHLKKGRSTILTTHSMEEADYLCTRIGIVTRGRMRCLGTSERLKTRFGNGYVLSVVATEGRRDEAEAYILQVAPSAQFIEAFAETVRYRVAKSDVVVSKVFRAFTEQRPPFVADWGLTMTTIEDVFLHIVRRDDEAAAQEAAAVRRASGDSL